jgi:hypothetical protein
MGFPLVGQFSVNPRTISSLRWVSFLFKLKNNPTFAAFYKSKIFYDTNCT